MTEFEEAMMIRAAAQGNEKAKRWCTELWIRTNGRDGLVFELEEGLDD